MPIRFHNNWGLWLVDSFRHLVGSKYVEQSKIYCVIARWSAGALVAHTVFPGVRSSVPGRGLFVSLDNDARQTFVCLAQVPPALPITLLALSLMMMSGALLVAVRKSSEFSLSLLLGNTGSRFTGRPETWIIVKQMLAGQPRGWRWWLRRGWWLAAACTGAAVVALTGALLRTSWPSILTWSVIGVLVWLILRGEKRITTDPYEGPASTGAARSDAVPANQSSMELIRAHSGLTDEQVFREYRQLGASGPLGLSWKLLGLVLVVLIYTNLSVPSVKSFEDRGVIGCAFVNLHDFFDVPQENFALAVTAAFILLLAMPLSVLEAHLRFMNRHRFPRPAMKRVLAQELLSAPMHALLTVVLAIPLILVVTAALWISAVVANASGSALLGGILFLTPVLVMVEVGVRFRPYLRRH